MLAPGFDCILLPETILCLITERVCSSSTKPMSVEDCASENTRETGLLCGKEAGLRLCFLPEDDMDEADRPVLSERVRLKVSV